VERGDLDRQAEQDVRDADGDLGEAEDAREGEPARRAARSV
jgi:hypothetical protein